MARIPKGRLVKGEHFNQYVGTVPSIFQLLYVQDYQLVICFFVGVFAIYLWPCNCHSASTYFLGWKNSAVETFGPFG